MPILEAPVPLCEDEEALLAFSVFYTGSIGAGAVWPALYGLLSDTIDLTTAMLLIATIVLLTLPIARQLRRFLSRRAATIAG